MTDQHLKYLEGLIKDYEKYCSVHGFPFPLGRFIHESIIPLEIIEGIQKKL